MNIPEPDLNSPTWPFVLAFAKRMEYKLSLNRRKGDRQGWLKMSEKEILDRIDDEVEELNEAFALSVTPDEAIAMEAADVANFCMMMADKITYNGK